MTPPVQPRASRGGDPRAPFHRGEPDEWVYTTEKVTPEQVADLNRLLAIRTDEASFSWDTTEDDDD